MKLLFCLRPLGRASAPTIPQEVHTIRGPNASTGQVVGSGVGAQDRPVVAQPARRVERPTRSRVSTTTVSDGEIRDCSCFLCQEN